MTYSIVDPEDYLDPQCIHPYELFDDEELIEMYYNELGVSGYENPCAQINYAEFITFLLEKTVIVKNSSGKLLFYNRNTGVYDEEDGSILGNIVRFLLDQPGYSIYSSRIKREVDQQLISYPMITLSKFNNGDVLTFRNMAFNVKKLAGVNFSPRHMNTIRIGYIYDPEMNQCPVFKSFIDVLTCGNVSRKILLQEITGYLFSPGNDAQRSFIFYGKARSGKSTYAKLCADLLGGVENGLVLSIPLKSLSSRFGLEGIDTARAIINSETGNNEVIDTTIYKAIVSGDNIGIEEKFKKQRTITAGCKILSFTNHYPQFTEIDPSVERRILIFPCDAVIGEDKIDTNLSKKLRKELPAIFNWAMVGLKRLQESGWKFSETEETKQLLKNYILRSDPLNDFITQYIREDCNAKFIKMCDIKRAFEKWSEVNNCGTKIKVTYNIFTDHIDGMGLKYTESAQNGYKGFKGLKMLKFS